MPRILLEPLKGPSPKEFPSSLLKKMYQKNVHRSSLKFSGGIFAISMPGFHTEEEKQCGCGCMKVRSSQEVSEQLDIIPAQHLGFNCNPPDF